jgi:heme iron utilization protein
MSVDHKATVDLDAIRAALEAEPDGVLDDVARRYRVSLSVILDLLPSGAARVAPGDQFAQIWAELTSWGPVMFIVHTVDGVFETKAALPSGTEGRGYFNIHGESPLGGHIRADRCAAIYFVDRPFFKRRSCSLQFINVEGGAMFKVFVRRDENRELARDQLARFEHLRENRASMIPKETRMDDRQRDE